VNSAHEIAKTPAMQKPTPGASKSTHGKLSSPKARPEPITPPKANMQKYTGTTCEAAPHPTKQPTHHQSAFGMFVATERCTSDALKCMSAAF
jgi:hypothetical protein